MPLVDEEIQSYEQNISHSKLSGAVSVLQVFEEKF